MIEKCQQKNILVVPRVPDNILLNNVEQTNEYSSESFQYLKNVFLNFYYYFSLNRILKSAMKVSIVAMYPYVRIDHEYILVFICANKPNIA
ncbi:unnamed protein product [Rotaria sp. Silwood2]|nr:unnamed protein product [Rotaria sp. Silwood2]CAF4254879.1 unnamed protein product [Rotaria sp. Silwood2]